VSAGPRRVAILISGTGSNMAHLVAALRAPGAGGVPAVVVSNRPGAAGLARARDLGVPVACVDACTAGRRSLEQKFATILGCSIYQHILQIRIGAAKKLLASTEEGLEAIAKTAGFAGAQHLCEVFKRKEGITPGTFRKQWRAQHAMP